MSGIYIPMQFSFLFLIQRMVLQNSNSGLTMSFMSVWRLTEWFQSGSASGKDKQMFKWVMIQNDGTIIEGEGNQKMLIMAMKTPDVVDGDVYWHGTWHNMNFWRFLIK